MQSAGKIAEGASDTRRASYVDSVAGLPAILRRFPFSGFAGQSCHSIDCKPQHPRASRVLCRTRAEEKQARRLAELVILEADFECRPCLLLRFNTHRFLAGLPPLLCVLSVLEHRDSRDSDSEEHEGKAIEAHRAIHSTQTHNSSIAILSAHSLACVSFLSSSSLSQE